MNINWKVRFKNPIFLAQLVASVFLPILAYMGITVRDLTSWETVGSVLILAVSNPYVLLMVVLSVYNAIIDPTTAGIADSKQAMTYLAPSDDKKKSDADKQKLNKADGSEDNENNTEHIDE